MPDKKESKSRSNKPDLSPKLKKKIIRMVAVALFVLVAFIKASVTSPPEGTTPPAKTRTEAREGSQKQDDWFGVDFNGKSNGFSAWLVDTLQGRNTKTAPWDILFYEPKNTESQANGDSSKVKSDGTSSSYTLNPGDYSGDSTFSSSGTESLGSFTYTGDPYTIVDDNRPTFSSDDYTGESYAVYSPFDDLGRCGPAYACLGKDLMPSSERESINSVKPSGWINKKYDANLVDGGYIYNRCHLIAFCLTGENANKYNLITGTRYFNVNGMLPFETQVADYIRDTGHHVLYRVTPIYDGDNLVASGVQMEAKSVEDSTVSFNVFVFNVQPGVEIDYATGNTKLASSS